MLFRITSLALLAAAVAAPAAAQSAAAPPPAPPRAPAMAPGESPEAMFTDAKIAATASASNFDEINPSQLALERAQTPAVRQYAQLMIDHHSRLEQGAQALLARKGMRPEDNAFSLQIKRNGPPTLEMLRAKTGRDFEKGYALQQIHSHQTTLHALDTSLIPSARDPELKAMLRDQVRPAVVDHLRRITAIHDQLTTTASR